MNDYYLTLILKSDLDEGKRKELLSGVLKKDTGESGKINKEDLWGNRDLAYPIEKHTKGFYAHYEFSADPAIIPTLDKNLRLEEDIIRYILLRK